MGFPKTITRAAHGSMMTLAVLLALPGQASAQQAAYQTLCNFDYDPNGAFPAGGVVEDAAGQVGERRGRHMDRNGTLPLFLRARRLDARCRSYFRPIEPSIAPGDGSPRGADSQESYLRFPLPAAAIPETSRSSIAFPVQMDRNPTQGWFAESRTKPCSAEPTSAATTIWAWRFSLRRPRRQRQNGGHS